MFAISFGAAVGKMVLVVAKTSARCAFCFMRPLMKTYKRSITFVFNFPALHINFKSNTVLYKIHFYALYSTIWNSSKCILYCIAWHEIIINCAEQRIPLSKRGYLFQYSQGHQQTDQPSESHALHGPTPSPATSSYRQRIPHHEWRQGVIAPYQTYPFLRRSVQARLVFRLFPVIRLNQLIHNVIAISVSVALK